VVDLSTQGLDLIVNLGKYREDNENLFFTLNQCLSAYPLHRKINTTSFDLNYKLALMKAHVKPSIGSIWDYHDEWLMRRSDVLEKSVRYWKNSSVNRFIGRTQIRFTGEQGVDVGGLTKEWFSLIARQGFGNSKYFDSEVVDGETFITPTSKTVSDLKYFRFFGCVVGKAVVNGQTIEVNFPNFLLKLMMGKSPKFHDIKQLDPQYFENNLKFIANSDLSGGSDYFFRISGKGKMEKWKKLT